MIDIQTKAVTIIRYSKGEWQDDGTFRKNKEKEFEIEVSAQPLTGNQVKLLPEHRRTAESLTVFTETPLFTSDEANQISADIMVYKGKRFEIFTVKDWSEAMDMPHYECIAIKEDGQGGGSK